MKKLLRSALLIFLATIVALQANPVFAQDSVLEENRKSALNDTTLYDPYFVAGCGEDAPIQGNGIVTENVESFVDVYGQAAFNIGKQYGIPYDAILAQAALESGYGKSELTRTANNFFGIKAGSGWNGPTVSRRTAEQNASGGVYYVTALFRAYPTPEAGFKGYAEFIHGNQRYAKALQYPKDPVRYIQEIKNAGYATDVSYVSKVVNILQSVQAYIASTGRFPPSSQVEPDNAPPPAAGTADGSCTPAAGQGGPVADIAIREAQQWVWQAGAFKKYTQGRAENWCADFVSWVYNEARRPLVAPPNLGQAGGWQIPAVTNLRTYLEQKGQFWLKDSNPAPPQPGDIVIQKQRGTSHTNIIVWADGFLVKTVGGNEGQTSGSQGSWFERSGVRMSEAPFDIRNHSAVTGWGRLP